MEKKTMMTRTRRRQQQVEVTDDVEAGGLCEAQRAAQGQLTQARCRRGTQRKEEKEPRQREDDDDEEEEEEEDVDDAGEEQSVVDTGRMSRESASRGRIIFKGAGRATTVAGREIRLRGARGTADVKARETGLGKRGAGAGAALARW